jgi:hypothetical protein
MATLTPPIEGYIEKVRDAAKNHNVKEKLRWEILGRKLFPHKVIRVQVFFFFTEFHCIWVKCHYQL